MVLFNLYLPDLNKDIFIPIAFLSANMQCLFKNFFENYS